MKKEFKDFNSFKTDFIYRVLYRWGEGNPFKTAFIYFTTSFILLYLLGMITGQFHGKNGLAPMYKYTLDNINLAFLAPMGAFLLCFLYNTINDAFSRFPELKIIKPEDDLKYLEFRTRLENIYNNKFVIFFCLLISIGINSYIHSVFATGWLGFKGGITGLYGRFFITVNYYVIMIVTYKCTITIWAIQQIMKMKINIRPFHPDRAGGLKIIGKLVFAVNYFMILIMSFLTLLFLFDSFTNSQPLYMFMILVFYFLSFYLLFASLNSTHMRMWNAKKKILDTLNNTIDHQHKKLDSEIKNNIFEIKDAEEMSSLQEFMNVVHKIPVWPFDTNTLLKFFTTITIPLLIFLINIVVNSDSILYNMDKLKIFQTLP